MDGTVRIVKSVPVFCAERSEKAQTRTYFETWRIYSNKDQWSTRATIKCKDWGVRAENQMHKALGLKLRASADAGRIIPVGELSTSLRIYL